MNTCSKCGAIYDGAELFCPKDGTRLGDGREMRKARASSIPPSADPLIGTVIQGRYRVISQLGEGGMGVVYVAEHVEIEKKVALKVLREDFSQRPEVVERFRQEARSASKIGHAHIVDVTDFGQLDNGGVYFVMEYLKGRSLSDVINEGPVPIERTANIVRQIAKALQAAHDLGIVHRDLKPENIFLVSRDENEDFVKVLDFGIAKISDRDSEGKRLTKTGMIFGTPEYMSPEQAAGRSLDHRVDVYALGCIMFEMFTGSVPFDGETFMAVLTQHMFEPVPPIEKINPETDVPLSVRNVVYKAMAKDADERYPDMTHLELDLERALTDAGYIVELPRAEQSVRLAKNSLRKTGQRGGNYNETLAEWELPPLDRKTGDKRKLPYIVLAASALLLLGIGVLFALTPETVGTREVRPASNGPKSGRDMTGDPVQVVATTKEKTESSAKADVEDKGEGERAASAPPQDSPSPEKVVVEVKTKPENAVISIGGMGQVCSSAPCQIELNAGEPVEIQARLGKRTAERIFTPSSQNKEIVLELEKTERQGSRRPHKKEIDQPQRTKNEPKGGKKKKAAGELKIPGIFIDN